MDQMKGDAAEKAATRMVLNEMSFQEKPSKGRFCAN